MTSSPSNEETPLIPTPQGKRVKASNYDDQPEDMTLSRKLSIYLSKFHWYKPIDDKCKASLNDAWAYFEHVTLPRYFVDAHEQHDDDYPKAEPGEMEKKTKLYPVLDTPEEDLADFGIGVGIYFLTLRILALIMFVAGLISLPNTLYFWSDEYNDVHEFTYHGIMRTSAVCSDHSWVACPTCTMKQLDYFPATFERYAEATGPNGDTLTFMEINNCTVPRHVGVVSYATLIFVCCAIYAFVLYTRHKEKQLDASQQTTSDYAIEVLNPPKDARDPEEWKDFFGQFGKVVTVTVSLNNEELMTALLKRRSLLMALRQLQPLGDEDFDIHDLAKAYRSAVPVAWYNKLMGGLDGPGIEKQLNNLHDHIENDLAKRKYDVSNIFVIFESEEAKEAAMQATQTSGLDLLFHRKPSKPPNCLFRGEHALHIVEPPEPSGVRWEYLDETFLTRVQQRVLTIFLTVVAIACGCALVILFRAYFGTVYAAFAVSGVNSAAPYVCQYLVSFESHAMEGSRQASLYYKITAFLWITTAMLTSIITPFVDTLKNEPDSLIPSMYSIFLTEMFVNPAIQLSDLFGNFQRHVLAPRARSQTLMSSYFQGTAYDLSERYTRITNILFLTFYYALLFPAGFFFASLTLCIGYWTDKFCILRVWSPAPSVGSNVADMSRTYFFSTALVVFAVMTAYGFASFPYDNACGGYDPIPKEYIGTFDATTGNGKSIEIDLAADDKVYEYCNQDMLQYDPPAFPPFPSKQSKPWMSEDQESFVTVYAYTLVAIVVIAIVLVTRRSYLIFHSMFVTDVQHTKRTCKPKNFDPEMGAYLPQAKQANDLFPVLFCDISNIDTELIPWEDPDHPYSHHNAIDDIDGLSTKPIWTTVSQWP